jgi:hypothetical protein
MPRSVGSASQLFEATRAGPTFWGIPAFCKRCPILYCLSLFQLVTILRVVCIPIPDSNRTLPFHMIRSTIVILH